jgi:plastocyanin
LSVLIPRLTEAGDDMVAAVNALASDEVEEAEQKLNEVEQRECGVSGDDEELAAGASNEIEADATRVDVAATEYAFQLTPPTVAGRTSFVLKNNGKEAHVAYVVKLAEGTTLEQAIQSESGDGVDGEWGTQLAASGEEEAVSFDLEPGNYGIVCYLPSADGTPHFALGMAQEFTVQ